MQAAYHLHPQETPVAGSQEEGIEKKEGFILRATYWAGEIGHALLRVAIFQQDYFGGPHVKA
eukprot:9277962-Ditylum_brightwellii.AAC.1